MASLSNPFYLTFTLVGLFVMEASSQASPSSCIQTCLVAAASSSSCSPTDANCICNSPVIIDAVETCVVGQCPNEAEAARTFFNNFCSGATSPSSGSFSVEPSTIESTQAPSSILSTPSSTSTPGSSPLFTSSASEPATPTQQSTTQQQSTTGPTTSITSRPSTGSTVSSASVTSSATSTPPTGIPSHADRGQTARLSTSIVFALAVALVVW